MKSALMLLALLLPLTGCVPSTNPWSYSDQKNLDMYYFSKNCSAALCNPR